MFGPTDVNDLGAFLRGLNAIENARSAMVYIDQSMASSDEKVLKLAVADTKDGIKVFTKSPLGQLFPNAVQSFSNAQNLLTDAIKNQNMNKANLAKAQLAGVSSQIVQ